MNENIDLTKILEGCPQGTKFYSSVYGEVSFEGIRDISIIYEYPIKLKAYNKYTDSTADIYYGKDGICVSAYDGLFSHLKTSETGQSLRGSGISRR